MKWWIWLAAPALLFGEAGVLIPSDKQEPDAAILSLREMEIVVRIDNGHATVKTKQIFENHTGAPIEGAYTFTVPGRALLSDFAVWDDVTRIPGVILERKRAEEIYNIAKAQAIDPGLLQQGERDVDEARRTAVFSARIVPIPAWGTKRVELEYQERLAVEGLQSQFSIPLRPDSYRAGVAGRLSIRFELVSAHPLKDFENLGKTYGLQVRQKTANGLVAEYSGQNVTLGEDFAVRYSLDPAKAESLQILAYRDSATEPGFFEADAVIGEGAQAGAGGPARTVVALFDTSLSMQWEKLERSFLGLEKLLRSLRPIDRFSVVLFNSVVTTMGSAGPVGRLRSRWRRLWIS